MANAARDAGAHAELEVPGLQGLGGALRCRGEAGQLGLDPHRGARDRGPGQVALRTGRAPLLAGHRIASRTDNRTPVLR
ncbi:hypothetical protein [Streptomyces microflavus]|uniref:hypothetical protein n=1 Tax=Streptomyces microflavus TaxID=1919 RepID=UPI00381F6127